VEPSVKDSSLRVFVSHSSPDFAGTLRREFAGASVSALRHNIAVVDNMHRVLAEDACQDSFYWYTSATADQRVQRELNLASLLRLIDVIRAGLRLVLIRVLSALSRRPAAINFALTLLASARCFGHRGESGDFVLPALASISVVTG
jgi:hypothetical protein